MVDRAESKDQSVMARLFDAEALGASFRELAVDVIPGETTEFMSRWFHAPRLEADLFIWLDGENRIIKHQLCFYGQVVEWNALHGTRTGVILEEEIPHVDGTPGADAANEGFSETIRFDVKAQDGPIRQAIAVLTNVGALSENERSTLIFNLRQSPKLHKNARERAMKAWKPKVGEILSDDRPTFWKRLKKWVTGN